MGSGAELAYYRSIEEYTLEHAPRTTIRLPTCEPRRARDMHGALLLVLVHKVVSF